jgi:hypothetical protein
MVELVGACFQLSFVLVAFKVAEHCEEDLSCEHRVGASLMHVALSNHSEELTDSLQTTIESYLVVDERFDV